MKALIVALTLMSLPAFASQKCVTVDSTRIGILVSQTYGIGLSVEGDGALKVLFAAETLVTQKNPHNRQYESKSTGTGYTFTLTDINSTEAVAKAEVTFIKGNISQDQAKGTAVLTKLDGSNPQTYSFNCTRTADLE